MSAMLAAIVTLILAPAFFQQGGARTGFGIAGRVVDARSGRPLVDAVVVLWERSKTRPTGRRLAVDMEGRFEFIDVPPGSYQLAAEVPGARFSYRTESLDIEVKDRNVNGLGLLITPFGPPLVTVNGRLVMEAGGRLPPSLTRIQAGGESSSVQPDGTFQFRLTAGEKHPITLKENLPEGYYIKSVSGGSWDSVAEVFTPTSALPSTVQFTLSRGVRRIRGRILDSAGQPVGPRAIVSLAGSVRSTPARNVGISADGTFEVEHLRAGDYEFKAQQGTGNATQFATLRVRVEGQDRTGIRLVLKPLTLQKGHVVIEGVGRLEELLRFRPTLEITDILGVRNVAIGRDGTFEFQSFVDEYSVEVNDLPIEYDPSIEVAGSSVVVRLRIMQRDAPLRFRSPGSPLR